MAIFVCRMGYVFEILTIFIVRSIICVSYKLVLTTLFVKDAGDHLLSSGGSQHHLDSTQNGVVEKKFIPRNYQVIYSFQISIYYVHIYLL